MCNYYWRNWINIKKDRNGRDNVKLVNNPKFKDALKNKVGAKTDTEELEKEREISRTRLRQTIGAKNKLAEQMDALDASDKFYDRKYDDLQERMNKRKFTSLFRG